MNAKNKSWYCPKDNIKGISLEKLCDQFNIHVLNSKNPTYLKSKNILDLTLCSNSLRKFFDRHEVLQDKISDHQPTFSTFKNTLPNIKKAVFQKTNWTKYSQILNKEYINTSNQTTKEAIESKSLEIFAAIDNALQISTFKFNIKSKPNTLLTIPQNLMNQIKQKRKIRRLMVKNKSSALKTIFNILNRKIKNSINLIKQTIITNKFKQLENFNQSESKHWKLLKKLENKPTNSKQLSIIDAGTIYSEDFRIVSLFAENLATTFASLSKITPPDKYKTDYPPLNQKKISINFTEFTENLAKLNSNASPGADKISNRALQNCPLNIQSICNIRSIQCISQTRIHPRTMEKVQDYYDL